MCPRAVRAAPLELNRAGALWLLACFVDLIQASQLWASLWLRATACPRGWPRAHQRRARVGLEDAVDPFVDCLGRVELAGPRGFTHGIDCLLVRVG
jgi:hypothetical protein